MLSDDQFVHFGAGSNSTLVDIIQFLIHIRSHSDLTFEY